MQNADMTLQCGNCQNTFPTNTSLYQHKHEVHDNSSLVLVNPTTQPIPEDCNTPRKICKKQKADKSVLRTNKRASPNHLSRDDDRPVQNIAKNEHHQRSKIKKEVRDECQNEVRKIKKEKVFSHKKLLESQHEKIQNLQRVHDQLINNINIAHKKELDDNEKEFQRKLNILNDQIKAMQEDDEDLSSLSKEIFNCKTMEEIFEIQKLVKSYQIDIVIQKHLTTLQNLFLSLSYGVLPISRPQREQVTDNQRDIVERIQTASSSVAKSILRENRAEIIKLFAIIKDSIKLARDSYNRFRIKP